MSAGAATALEEWKKNWTVVLAGLIGISFFSFMAPALGLFFEPIHKEFGWTLTQMQIGMSVGGLITFFGSPFAGRIIDLFGSRRLAIPGIILTALTIAGFGFANGNHTQWLAIWVAFGLISLAVKTTVWSTAVAGVFSTSRGLALGVALSGTAWAQIIVSPLGRWLIDTQGWRAAFVWLGLGWGAIALIFCVLFMFDVHDQRRKAAQRGVPIDFDAPALYGLSIAEAWRSWALWRVAIVTLLVMSVTIATTTQQFNILRAVGITREEAGWIGSFVGVAAIIGKLITGVLLDRYHVRWVGGMTLGITTFFWPFLIPGFGNKVLAIIAILVSGYTAGTKIQISNYVTARYAGIRNYGTIFGFMASMIALASAIGPLAATRIFDTTGSYEIILWAGSAISLISGALILSLGSYPDWTKDAGSR